MLGCARFLLPCILAAPHAFVGVLAVVSQRKPTQLDWIGGVELPHKQWPSDLRGKNIVFGGDSNDRKFMWSLCESYNAKVETFSNMRGSVNTKFANMQLAWMRETDEMKDGGAAEGATNTRSRLAVPRVCHLNEQNASLLYLYHPGVMSMTPRPEWHRLFLEFPGSLRRRLEFSPRINGNLSFASSDELAQGFWKSAIEDHLPRRPIIFILQSSAWDSEPAFEHQLFDEGVFSRNDLDKWNWLVRASKFVQAVQETFSDSSGPTLERVCWRTNPNCPWSAPAPPGVFRRHPVSNASKLMAQEVREVVGRSSPWKDVCLVDWDGHYAAAKEDDCKSLHYQADGYAGYMDALWEAFQSGSGENTGAHKGERAVPSSRLLRPSRGQA